MQFLAPTAFFWFLSIPVLLWLWRLASTYRQVRVPSLIPFEQLLRKSSNRRTRLVTNVLFWIQLLALLAMVLALARPVKFARRMNTTLAVLDTSASMSARQAGTTAFEHARRSLLDELKRKKAGDAIFLMITAPPTALTPQPVSDLSLLERLIASVKVTQLGGNLSSTEHLGRALLGRSPDRLIIATDEPAPEHLSDKRITWIGASHPAGNFAVVSVEASTPLCAPQEGRLAATVQNFSDKQSKVTVTARQEARLLAQTPVFLEPHARQSVTLGLPPATQGMVELLLQASPDSLEADNRAWVDVEPAVQKPVILRLHSAPLFSTVTSWLSACPAVRFSSASEAVITPETVLITDKDPSAYPRAGSTVWFLPPENLQVRLNYWTVSADHPIAAYLNPVEAVAAAINTDNSAQSVGIAVVTALIGGKKYPVVTANEQAGKRLVTLRLDPSNQQGSIPILLSFFNSLRWVMGTNVPLATGATLTASGLSPGPVTVILPDGEKTVVTAVNGAAGYSETSWVGVYRFVQANTRIAVPVNLFNPLESNTWDRPSTWNTAQPLAEQPVDRPVPNPLASWFLLVFLAGLLAEWWLYTRRKVFVMRSAGAVAR